MSSTILSSPFLNQTVLDGLLSDSSLTPSERIQYLSAKLSLLVNPSASSSTSSPSSISKAAGEEQRSEIIIQELELRLRLGLAHLNLTPPDFRIAEGELGVVEKRCKGLLQRGPRVKGVEVASLAAEEGDVGQGGTKDGETRAAVPAEDETWLNAIRGLRSRAIEGLIQVDEGLGRGARAERWKEVLKQISHESDAATG